MKTKTSKKERKSGKKPLLHKKKLEKPSGLEVELEDKKAGEEADEVEEEPENSSEFAEAAGLNFNEIDSNSELRRALSFRSHNNDADVLRRELEGLALRAGIMRVSSGRRRESEAEKMNYSEMNYDADLYSESKYAEKTPDYTARESQESGGEREFQTRAGRNSGNEIGEEAGKQ